MKLVIAYIQPDKLDAVTESLNRAGLHRISATNALGCGSQKGYSETYRGAETSVRLLKKVRLEIAVNDAFVKPCIAAIVEGARTGTIGDGKIFVLDLPRCIRIRTLEEGGEAIG